MNGPPAALPRFPVLLPAGHPVRGVQFTFPIVDPVLAFYWTSTVSTFTDLRTWVVEFGLGTACPWDQSAGGFG